MSDEQLKHYQRVQEELRALIRDFKSIQEWRIVWP